MESQFKFAQGSATISEVGRNPSQTTDHHNSGRHNSDHYNSENLQLAADLGQSESGQSESAQSVAVKTTHGVYVTLHGHFYQPPRENPYLGTIEHQPSAAPFHNWNERIHHECYRPNAFARIFNESGEVMEIVNNYEYLSFNIGPTLMRWLEHYDAEVYQRILEADRKSCDRLNGHGNAIAQVYNHIILPLANRQDKVTQIRWGKADFQSRFGREPEGMWLAEAAVDYETLQVLVEEGIKFIILAPSQLQRCRPLNSEFSNSERSNSERSNSEPLAPEADQQDQSRLWQEVGGGQIDPTRPYRCFVPGGGDRNRDYIDIFVYDGPISRDIGFEDRMLSSSEQFIDRIGQAVRPDRTSAQLIAIATDGETFGHHKRHTEKALAYGFRYVMPQRGWTITNFAHYLSLHQPTWEVEIKPITAWSCAHGVDRWQEDCGCGGEGSVWHQQWRRPLRNALDWLRDRLIQVFNEQGDSLFSDPWAARNDYISALLTQLEADGMDGMTAHVMKTVPLDQFLRKHQLHPLNPTEQVDALRLLEMQRYALFMYTSCGWFFEEISRPEGVQILRYAARAIALANEVAGINLEPMFIEHLALAPSNVAQFQTGAEVYRQLVQPSQVSLHQIIAHYGMSSIFSSYPVDHSLYGYRISQGDYEKHQIGKLTLVVGHLLLTAEATRDSTQVIFAVLHMGGWDFHCVVQPFTGRPYYTALKQALFEQLQLSSLPQLILVMNQYFGEQHYGIQDLYAEDRHRLLAMLSQETLMRLDQLYTQVYRDNSSLLMAYRRDGLDGPQELVMAAQVALSHRAIQLLQSLTSESVGNPVTTRAQLTELEAIATEAEHLGCQLNLDRAAVSVGKLLQQWFTQGLHRDDVFGLKAFMKLVSLLRRLDLTFPEDRLQEQYIQFLQQHWVSHRPASAPTDGVNHESVAVLSVAQSEWPGTKVQLFLKLGKVLAIDMHAWLALLQCRSL